MGKEFEDSLNDDEEEEIDEEQLQELERIAIEKEKERIIAEKR